MIFKCEGGVNAPLGFSAMGVFVGIKKTKKDMAMIMSQVPCIAAGTYTTNQVKAAPVLWDQKITEESGVAQAIVCNSGIANACTGEVGMQYCKEMAQVTADTFGINPDHVLVASTGVIGEQLPMDKISQGIQMLGLTMDQSADGAHLAAEAIMTTDTKAKEVSFEFRVAGQNCHIGGMCKGSGMIHPNMCTMLSFITTDVKISKELLQEALKEDIKDTYNMVSVDGDTSTNDSVLLLANGLADNKEITEKDEDYATFVEALHAVNEQLAKEMAADGEGATSLFEVKVVNADKKESAIEFAKTVVGSSLVKAAICGRDANWGRIMGALGRCSAKFNPEQVDITFASNKGNIQVVEGGMSTGYDEEKATDILTSDEVTCKIDMHMGDAEATAWGCDLTHEYVSINADYRS
ncbi:MAG: bifunctional ornithine acetyltransferase/N-acetylglutamate synthase [Eubacterium sp.]|nr:bifunctional ornithine acetyltransferase/N-acetylglutamate synthase [Eubacterium sp.]